MEIEADGTPKDNHMEEPSKSQYFSIIPRTSFVAPGTSFVAPRTSFVVPRPSFLAPRTFLPSSAVGSQGGESPQRVGEAVVWERWLAPYRPHSPPSRELLGTTKEVLGFP